MAAITTPINRLTEKQLQNIISGIDAIQPNPQGRYVYEGTTYTKAGLAKIKKQYSDRLAELQLISETSLVEFESRAGMRREEAQAEIDKVNRSLVEITTRIEDLRSAADRSETIGAQNNLRSWQQFYTAQANRLQKYVDNLKAGTARVGDVETDVKLVSVEQAAQKVSPGGAVAQPETVYGGMPATGAAGVTTPPTPTTPVGGVVLTGGLVSANIPTDLAAPDVTPEKPAEDQTPAVTTRPETTVTTDTTTTPGVTVAPGAPQYAPGQEIGGPDRALPDGGAVVDGKYVPPGIDYTWLANQVPDDWKKAAQELYGAYYDMIKNDLQISNLLERAIKESWSDDKFQVELEKTNWWKTTTDNAKSFQILETTRPAEARARLDGKIATVREYAQNMGVTLSAESLESLARTSIILDFNLAAQYQDAIGSEAIKSAGGMSQLRYGYVGNSIRESARKYGVALSDVTFNEWVNKIAVGAESTETFESYANQIARNLYPSLNNGFDRGLSFAQMTNPYAQVASRILEIPGDSIDFTDPKWAAAFTMRNQKGEQQQMSFGEWADYLRTTPAFGYEYTDDAVSKAYNVVSDLARAFGAG